MAGNVVYFAHGKDSGPWGTKITRLAEVARENGFDVMSPDYSTTMNADKRVEILLKIRPQVPGKVVLVGSSMGGYVSTVASSKIEPDGLFLMAPAFYIHGYKEQDPKPCSDHTVIVHGWHDDVVPLEKSLRFAKKYAVPLHILDSDHRLTSVLDQIADYFSAFLDDILRK